MLQALAREARTKTNKGVFMSHIISKTLCSPHCSVHIATEIGLWDKVAGRTKATGFLLTGGATVPFLCTNFMGKDLPTRRE